MTERISSLTDITAVRDYLARVGAEPRSLKTAVVRETIGNYWNDVAVIRFSATGEISCSSLEHSPTELEQATIMDAWARVEFPRIKRLSRIINPPPMMRSAAERDIFEFRTVDGREIIMVQVRIEREGEDGALAKNYVPWTYWDDDVWRMCEPDGELPLYGIDQLPAHRTVFIHEGAKAAAYCRWLVEGATKEARDARAAHPWGEELSGAAHVGWIGGAMNPNRTDWSVLAKNGVERAYIVADNDEPGRRAIASISRAIRIKAFSVEFNDRFPVSFDLADPFPETMFKTTEGRRFYVGPSMRALLSPATWATDMIPNPNGKGRPVAALREGFKGMWAYVEEADAFVCKEMPEIMRTESVFNKVVAGFSHVNDTAKLLVKAYKGRTARICYRPDYKGLTVDYRGANAINTHVPTTIKAIPGDPEPFLEFLRYLFVNPEERRQVERWCATLIARPEIRMDYGLLLVSERQGMGKTTLGAHILAPLVGEQNAGYPSEKDIGSDFNDWVAHKRLAIVNEIYSGSSWKSYHALKSIITDQDITVNQKYVRQYVIDNWCHVVACSNSMRALKMENDDRRWFYPEVTEVPWPRKKFAELRSWAQGGGLSIVRYWAENYGDYVARGERAPMTERKRELIEGSRSEAQREAAALAEQLKDRGTPGALLIKDVVGWAKSAVQGRVHDSDYEIRRVMMDCGLHCWSKRIKVHGHMQYALINDALMDLAQRAEDPLGEIRKHVVKASSLMESEM
jgi:hypothetical protein